MHNNLKRPDNNLTWGDILALIAWRHPGGVITGDLMHQGDADGLLIVRWIMDGGGSTRAVERLYNNLGKRHGGWVLSGKEGDDGWWRWYAKPANLEREWP